MTDKVDWQKVVQVITESEQNVAGGAVFAVCLFDKLFPRKTRLANVAPARFARLAGQTAAAIFSVKSYGGLRRQLNTAQGLIDLVTS